MVDRLDAIQEIEQDHRNMRDGLLEMIGAFDRQDIAAARDIFGKINVLAGPHFRYEEEALYPKLRFFFGSNVDRLIREHDDIVAAAKAFVDLLKKERLTTDEEQRVLAVLRDTMFHISNCSGLAIFAERLSKKEIEELGLQLAAARKAGLPFLEWMNTRESKSRGSAVR